MNTLEFMRRRGAPVALLTYLALLSSLVPRTAFASSSEGNAPAAEGTATPLAPQVANDNKDNGSAAIQATEGSAGKTAAPALASATRDEANGQALAGSSAALAAASLAPQTGEGGSDGVGPNQNPVGNGSVPVATDTKVLDVDRPSGAATYSYPFELPPARGMAQPHIGMVYSSRDVFSTSRGWNLAGPSFIVRAAKHGTSYAYTDPLVKNYDDGHHSRVDDFLYLGRTPLAVICKITNNACTPFQGAGLSEPETFPAWANGWTYYRPTNDNDARFFYSSNSRTWRIQHQTGLLEELGEATDGLTPSNDGIDLTKEQILNVNNIMGWHVVRQWDAHQNSSNQPYNKVVYLYGTTPDGATKYLTQIFDTPPAGATNAPLADYAHHTELVYTEFFSGYGRYYTLIRKLPQQIVVTTKGQDAAAPRQLLRRYHLAYDQVGDTRAITSIKLEGRCSPAARPVETSNGSIPYSQNPVCGTLPPATFTYYVGNNAVNVSTAFVGRGLNMTTATQNDLLDVDGDGKPEVIAPSTSASVAQTVYFNSGTSSTLTVGTTLNGTNISSIVNSTNLYVGAPNVLAGDFDGDGRVDLLFLKKGATDAQNMAIVFTLTALPTRYEWTPQPTYIPNTLIYDAFLNTPNEVRVGDANADRTADILYTTATGLYTFYARYESNTFTFGGFDLTGEPLPACRPLGTLRFSDPSVKFADIDGDGMADIIRIVQGKVQYWRGRPDGQYGESSLCTGRQCQPVCGSPTGGGNPIEMPFETNYPNLTLLATTRFADFNGDGSIDMMQIGTGSVTFFLQRKGMFDSHVTGTFTASQTASRTRVGDLAGSTAPDGLLLTGNGMTVFSLVTDTPNGYMKSSANGQGARWDLTYRRFSPVETPPFTPPGDKTAFPPLTKSFLSFWLLSRIDATDSLSAMGRTEWKSSRSFDYVNYAASAEGDFVNGFEWVSEVENSDVLTVARTTYYKYLLGICPTDAGWCPKSITVDPQLDEDAANFMGLLVYKQIVSGTTPVSVVHETYRSTNLYNSPQANLISYPVRQVRQKGEQRYRFDSVATTATQDVSFVDYMARASSGTGDLSKAATYKVPSASGRAKLDNAYSYDQLGHLTVATNNGCIEGCSPVDTAVFTNIAYAKPAGDVTAYNYRMTSSYVHGQVDTTRRHEQTYVYNAFGDLTNVLVNVSGTAPLVRSNFGNPVAGTTGRESLDGNGQRVEVVIPDVYGSTIGRIVADTRCSVISYDPTYAQQITATTVYAGFAPEGCGPTLLTTNLVRDRALNTILMATDPNGAVSTWTYDEFGRLLTVTRPNPSTGIVSSQPALKLDYGEATDLRPLRTVHKQIQDGTTSTLYHHAYSYRDGLGRLRMNVHEGDTSAGDPSAWIVTDVNKYDARGRVAAAYEPYGSAGPFTLTSEINFTSPTSSVMALTRDALGRITVVKGLDGVTSTENAYHALSADSWGRGGKAAHASRSVTTRMDGLGRTIAKEERFLDSGSTGRRRQTKFDFLPSGETTTITQSLCASAVLGSTCTASGTQIVRQMTYDTLGREVTNNEPNSSKGSQPWRYAYDIAGLLVGTSDPRGCGQNIFYDGAGRVLATDYSPCEANHADYSPIDYNDPHVGAEVKIYYDDPGVPFSLGRATKVAAPGALTSVAYDARGRVTTTQRQIGIFDAGSDFYRRYAADVFSRTTAYDNLDRVTTQSTGATSAEVQAPSGGSSYTFAYSGSGYVRQITSTYGPLVTSIAHAADGLPTSVKYGDAAATATDSTYDTLRRLTRLHSYRASVPNAPATSAPPTTFQLNLEDTTVGYDDLGRISSLADNRNSAEWPAGTRPVRTSALTYDELDRLTGTSNTYVPSDTWVSPLATEIASGSSSPVRPTPLATRPVAQSYTYDWKGNVATSDDDLHATWDRSLGTASYDASSNRLLSTTSSKGNTSIEYDRGGNVSKVIVTRQSLCATSTPGCYMVFKYEWDELGRLATAERDELSFVPTSSTQATLAAKLRYLYDSNSARTVKEVVIGASGTATYDVDVFSSLRLKKAAFFPETLVSSASYEHTGATENVYLSGVARVYYLAQNLPTSSGGKQHVFFELRNQLGSTSTVIDDATGELVERVTYQPYGATESDYRPDRWKNFRDDYRFTQKEDDLEVGLTYFGARYYSPFLMRWISPDPLTVHAAGADLNPYAYVGGNVTGSIDLYGLAQSECYPGMMCAGDSGDSSIISGYSRQQIPSYNGGPTAMNRDGSGSWKAPSGMNDGSQENKSTKDGRNQRGRSRLVAQNTSGTSDTGSDVAQPLFKLEEDIVVNAKPLTEKEKEEIKSELDLARESMRDWRGSVEPDGGVRQAAPAPDIDAKTNGFAIGVGGSFAAGFGRAAIGVTGEYGLIIASNGKIVPYYSVGKASYALGATYGLGLNAEFIRSVKSFLGAGEQLSLSTGTPVGVSASYAVDEHNSTVFEATAVGASLGKGAGVGAFGWETWTGRSY